MNGTNGSIAGRVVSAAGAPVHGASVVVVEGPGPVRDIAPLSGADGRFHLKGLAPGTYKLAAHGAGSATGQSSVVVSAGQEAAVEIRLDN